MRLLTVHWLAVLAVVLANVGCESAPLPVRSTTAQAANPNPHFQPDPASQRHQRPTFDLNAEPKPTRTSNDGVDFSKTDNKPNRTTQPTQAPTAAPTPAADGTLLDVLIQPADAASIGYRLGWASPVKLINQQRITHVTVVDDIAIVIEEPVNTVTALRVSDGSFLWKINLGSDLEQLFPPTRDGNQLFIHSAIRFFTLEARTGRVTAVANLDTTVGAAAVYSPNTRLAILTGVNGMCFAHSVDNNFPRWRYKMANRMATSAVLAGQDIFLVDTGGTYAMIEGKSGRPLWRNHTLGPVRAAPGIQDSEMIVSSTDGKVYAINRTTGRDTWQYLGAEQPLISSPIVLGRTIVQPLTPSFGLVALDTITGKETWRSESNATPVMTTEQGLLLFNPESLQLIDLNTGKTLGEAATKPLMNVVPAGDDGSVILVNGQGRLMKLSPI